MVTIGVANGHHSKLRIWLVNLILGAWFLLELSVFAYFIVLVFKKGL